MGPHARTWSYRVISAFTDVRFDHFKSGYDAAISAYADGEIGAACYLLGLGLHSIQDSWAHGNMAAGGDHAKYADRKVDRNPDGRGQDRGGRGTHRWTQTQMLTKTWLRSFFHTVGVRTR
jgi:hypothetical protein